MEEQNQTAPTNGMPPRKLKKIKRPVKRIMPGEPGYTPSSVDPITAKSSQFDDLSVQEASLDELLDSQLNLPSIDLDDNNTLPSLNDLPTRDGNQPNKAAQAQYTHPTRFLNESDLAPSPKRKFVEQLMEDGLFTWKGVVVFAVLAFILGILVVKIMSGGKTVVKDGLQGVVVNAEVPRGRARCGVAERTQGCVLYIMNPQRKELQGRDFYDLASQLTGRQRFVVETGNMRYSNVKIRPGELAQINIPPLQ